MIIRRMPPVEVHELYALNWSYFGENLKDEVSNFESNTDFTDVTFVCQEKTIHAHRFVLHAGSDFFRDFFKNNPIKNPIFVMYHVKSFVLQKILKFLYHGEVQVEKGNFEEFIHLAESLKVKGIVTRQGSTAETFIDEEVATAETIIDEEVATAETFIDEEVATAETIIDDEVSTTETIIDNEVSTTKQSGKRKKTHSISLKRKKKTRKIKTVEKVDSSSDESIEEVADKEAKQEDQIIDRDELEDEESNNFLVKDIKEENCNSTALQPGKYLNKSFTRFKKLVSSIGKDADISTHVLLKGTRRRCGKCSMQKIQKRTGYYCKICDIGLCKSCFIPFHDVFDEPQVE